MSMSKDMVQEYVKSQLHKAVASSILKGETELASGHPHEFAIAYDDNNKMFVGETSFGGDDNHAHYVMAGIHDVNSTDGDAVNLEVDVADLPASMRCIVELYNLKTIAMATTPHDVDGHTHTVAIRFVGHSVEVPAKQSIFDGQEHLDADCTRAKSAKASAEEELEALLLKAIRPSVVEQPAATLPSESAVMPEEEVLKQKESQAQPGPDVEIGADGEFKDEAGSVSSPASSSDIADVVDGAPKTTAELLVEELRGATKKSEEELMALVEAAMQAEKDKKDC